MFYYKLNHLPVCFQHFYLHVSEDNEHHSQGAYDFVEQHFLPFSKWEHSWDGNQNDWVTRRVTESQRGQTDSELDNKAKKTDKSRAESKQTDGGSADRVGRD